MSEWQLVRYVAACPRCGVDVEWHGDQVFVAGLSLHRSPGGGVMGLPYRWHPQGTTWKRRPDVGDLLPFEHAVWRVVEVYDLPADRVSEKRQPFAVVIRPVQLGDDVKDRSADQHLAAPRYHLWDVYPDGHYPICASCLEPLPCREKTATRIAEAESKHMGRYELAGVCPACQEPVTARQKSLTWEDNVEVIGGPPVTYHARRRGCRRSAVEYEKRWVAADPERRRAVLSCPGNVINHGDGTYECSEYAACPGARAEHGGGHEVCGFRGVICCSPPPRGCFPAPDSVRRT